MHWLYRVFDVEYSSKEVLDVFHRAYKDGFKAMLLVTPASIIWAIVTAVAMVSAGMSPFYVMLTNIIVYAASAQLTVLSMLMVQAPLPVIWLSAAIVNLRFVIFSASYKPYFRHLKLFQRLLYGFFNSDINSMLFNFRYRNRISGPANNEHKGFFVGVATVNFVGWQIGCLIGVLFVKFIPSSWGLELAAVLTLLILVIQGVEHWAGISACIVATIAAVSLQNLPYKLWVLAAIIAGVSVGLVVEQLLPDGYLKSRAKVNSVEEVS